MSDSTDLRLKICLLGEGAVGKTSLIRRFVFDEFDDAYITTIGTKITKKEVRLHHPTKDKEVNVTLLVWDLMGQKGFRNLLQEAYFYGAHGLIAVCDITNKDSLTELEEWVDSAYSVTEEVPVVFLANKSDLKDDAVFTLDDVKQHVSKFKRAMYYTSSAKTGENVEKVFETMSNVILKE